MIKLPSVEEFAKLAVTIYETTRDQDRPHAVLTIAEALVQIWNDGATEVLRDEREKIDLMLAKVGGKVQ